MPYIGNPSAQRFTSPRAASVYSGDGSTVAFTLEEAVSTDEDILVSVDGVIQEPSVAYAVSSGTTLTFTAAPSSNSGNNIFVYYIARTLGSVSMPDGQNVNASNFSASGTGAITGNTTVGGTLGVTGATTLSSDLTIPDKIIHAGDTDTAIRFSAANEVKVETGGDEIVKFSSGATVFNNGGVNMDFRVEGDTDTELFFIDAGNEKVSIGTSTSDGFLHIKKNYQSDIGMSMNDTSGSGGTAIRFKINGTTKGSIAYSGSGTSFNTSSDYRLKENVSYTWDATSRLKQLKPARFNWINDDTNTFVDGFLAHEVSSIVPEAITGEKDDTQDVGTLKDKDGNVKAENVPESVKENAEHTWTKTGTENVYQEIDQDKLVPLLVKSLQEALTEIDTLKTKVAALESN